MQLRSLRRVTAPLTLILLASLLAPPTAVHAVTQPVAVESAPSVKSVPDSKQSSGRTGSGTIQVSPPYKKDAFVEDVAQRTAYRKVLKKGEETRVLLSLTPWHYEVSPGVWTDIDNALVTDTGAATHHNKANKFTAQFTEKAQGNQFHVELNGRSVTMDLPEDAMGAAGVKAKVNKQKIRYESEGSPIAIDYEMASTGVIEDIWLLRRGAPAQLHFNMSLQGVTPELQPDGTLWFVKNESVTERAFYIPAPFVEDANGATGKAEYQVKQLGQDRWQLSLQVDRHWLDETGRAWPVRVDPTLWVDSDGGQWKQVTNGSAPSDDKYVTIGFQPTRDIHLQWNLGDMGLQGQVLSNATLTMRMPATIDSDNNLICDTCGARFTIFQEKQEWFRQSATWTQPAWQGTAWVGGTPCTTAPCSSMTVTNNKSAAADYGYLVNGSAFADFEYDVTSMVRTWLEGSVPNNGFYFTNLYPASLTKPYVMFYSPLYMNWGSYLQLSFTNVAPPTFQKVGGSPTQDIDINNPSHPSVTVVSQESLIQTQLYVDGVLADTNTTTRPGTLPFTLDASRFPYGTHRLTVRTFTGTGQMAESLPVELTFGEAGLTPPSNLVVVPLPGGGSRLTWAPSSANRPNRTVSYSIHKSGKDQSGTSLTRDLGEAAGTSFDDPPDTITPTTKSYSIEALAHDAGTGATTARSPAVVGNVVSPIRPTGLTYRPLPDGRALLLWTASPSSQFDATLQYQIYRDGTLLTTTAATEYVVEAPSASGSTLSYWVAAVRGSGHSSANSESVKVGYMARSAGSEAPVGLSAAAEPGRAINLSWNGVTEAGVTYDLTRYVADVPLAISPDSFLPVWTGISCCSYQDAAPDLQEGTGYWYRVRTVRNGVAGPWSEPFGAVASTQRRTGLDQRQAFVESPLGKHGATVNLSSGNLALSAVDSAVSLPNMGQSLARIYNSHAAQSGTILGGGWRLNAEWTVEAGTDWAVVTEGDGTEHRFQWNGSAYAAEEWYYGRLERTASGWLLTYPDFKSYAFATDGRLQSISDRNGVEAVLYYTDGLLRQLVSPRSGRSIQFTYDGLAVPARLTQVSDSAARVTTYQYDAQGRLTAVTNQTGEVAAYQYDGNGRLIAVQDSAQRSAHFAYGANGGVSALFDALGNGLTFRYLSGRTVVSDALNEQTTYALNGAGWPTAVTDALQNTTTFSYLLAGTSLNTFTVTNPRGLVTAYSYDSAGRVVKVLDKSGLGAETADLVAPGVTSRETLRTYNALGDLTDEYVEVGDTVYHGSHLEYIYEGNHITSTVTQRVTRTGMNAPALVAGTLEQRFDSFGRPVSVKDPNGNRTVLAYGPDGTLLSVTAQDIDADLRAKNATSDAAPRNVEQSFTYDTRNDGRPTGVYDWHRAGAPGPATEIQYDVMGRVTMVSTPAGARSYTFYDAEGVPSMAVDAGGRMTTTLYDAVGRTDSVINADGGTISYQYDPAGRTVAVKDPLNHTTTMQYDPLNRVTRVIDANGLARGYVYDKVGNVVGLLSGAAAILDQNKGYRVSASYYLANIVRQSKEPLPTNIITTTAGVTLPPTDPGDPANTTYNITSYQYNRLGQVSQNIDANGYRTGYTYDDADRLASVAQKGIRQYPATTKADLTTTYSYDLNGNRTAVTDPLLHVARAYYDGLNRVWRELDANGATLRDYRFDDAGRLVRTIEPRGYTATKQYSYDLGNNVTAVTYTRTGSNREYQAKNVQYAYDAAGKRIFMWDGYGASYYSYDSMGRLQHEQRPNDAVAYEHDLDGNLTAMGSHLGRITYNYDNGNRVSQVKDPFGYATTYAYNADYGHLTSLSLPLNQTSSKVVRRDTYATLSDGRMTNRLQEIKYQMAGSGTQLWKGTYTYDLVGMIRTFVDTTPLNHAYTYDEAYRLIEADGASGNNAHKTSRYAYDKAGNRKSWGNDLVSGIIYNYDSAARPWTITGTMDANNRVKAVTCKYGATTETMAYVYEANGNQVQEAPDVNVPTCPATGNLANTAFDDANRLARYENWANADNHVTLDYGYDGDGNRLFQKYGRYRYNYATAMDDLIESDYTQYQYANGKVLNERNNSGVPVWYIRDPYGNLLYTLHWRSSSLKPDVYVQDHLGSVRMIVDNTGVVTNKITYDAFGAITSSSTTLRNSYEFTGLPRDVKSGYNYAYARYYKPGLGRFITQDTWKGSPWQPWTQNLYAYVGNNPANFVDPTGNAGQSPMRTTEGTNSGGTTGARSITRQLPMDDGNRLVFYSDGSINVRRANGTEWSDYFVYHQSAGRVVVGNIIKYGGEAAISLPIGVLTGGSSVLVQLGVAGGTGIVIDKTFGDALKVPESGQVDVIMFEILSTTPRYIKDWEGNEILAGYTVKMRSRNITLLKDGSVKIGEWQDDTRDINK